MNIKANILLRGADHKAFLADFYEADEPNGNLLVFCHGFKGFKDWGCWHEMAKRFASKGFHFVKFNFSHNGTTIDAPMDFKDLEAFSENTFSKELNDLNSVVHWAFEERKADRLAFERLHLIGHSRSGPIVIIRGLEDERIASVTTWAGVADLRGRLTPGQVEEWKEKGVIFVSNSRTGQEMPLKYLIYEDYITHATRFDLAIRPKSRHLPMHFIHGDEDKTVPVSVVEQLKSYFPWAKVDIIHGTGHSFGCKHPPEEHFPKAAEQLVECTSEWIHAYNPGHHLG